MGNLQRLQNLTVLLVTELDCVPASQPEGLYQRKGGRLPEVCVSQSWGTHFRVPPQGHILKGMSSRHTPDTSVILQSTLLKRIPSSVEVQISWTGSFVPTKVLGLQVRHMGQSQLVLFTSHVESEDVHVNV